MRLLLGLSSHFSLLAPFEFIGALVAEGGMAPAAVVKQLYVFEDPDKSPRGHDAPEPYPAVAAARRSAVGRGRSARSAAKLVIPAKSANAIAHW